MGKTINCPPRGERIVVLESARESRRAQLYFDQFIDPGRGFFPAHFHVEQTEHYEVLAGTAIYTVDGVEFLAKQGDTVVIPPGNKHVDLWNRDGKTELHLRRKFIPALGMQTFIETWFGCVRDNRHATRDGNLNLLQTAVTAAHIGTNTWNAWPSETLQRLGVPLLAIAGRLIGYKPYYQEYTDLHYAQLYDPHKTTRYP
jgi:signal peptidase I